MAFDYTNLYPDTSSAGGYCKAWSYTTLDSIATASASGYFNAVATRIAIGDVITVSVVDAYIPSVRTALVDYAVLYVVSITAGVVTTVASTALPSSDAIVFTFDGNVSGSALTTGVKGYMEIPFACTITVGTLLADRVGSIVVDIYKCTYAQFDGGSTHPVVGDKITDSNPLTISSATKAQDSVLTGWTRTIAAGDILAFNINSVATIQRASVTLKITHTS